MCMYVCVFMSLCQYIGVSMGDHMRFSICSYICVIPCVIMCVYVSLYDFKYMVSVQTKTINQSKQMTIELHFSPAC